MSSSRRKFWIAFYSVGAIAIGAMTVLPACSQAPTPSAEPATHTAALQTTSGAELTTVTWWLIAPNGTTTSGTITPVPSSSVTVPLSNLVVGSSYKLIVSGVTSDGGVVGCSGSTTFTARASSIIGGPVPLLCSDGIGRNKPDAGELLTATVNICPVIDGVSANPASVTVGQSMALGVMAHDPDSGPAALTYNWTASSGTLTGSTTASPTFTCTRPGSVTITVAPSDGDPNCRVSLPFTVACTGP